MSSWKDIEVRRRIRIEAEDLVKEAVAKGDGSEMKLREALGRLKSRKSLIAQTASADLGLAAARADDLKLAEKIKVVRDELDAVLFG